jgi:hypothetical protein
MSKGYDHTIVRRDKDGWIAIRFSFDQEVCRGYGANRNDARAAMLEKLIPMQCRDEFKKIYDSYKK